MKDFFENLFEDIDTKKLLIFSPIVLIVLGLVLWFAFSPDGEEVEAVEETVPLSDSEQGVITTNATNFINTVGNFGFDYQAAANTGSVIEAKKVAQSYPNDENLFFTSRATSYLDARDMIAENSPLYYPSTQALSWSNEIEIGNMERLFRVEDVNIDVPETVSKVDFQGGRYDMATVDVELDSQVSYAKQTATDVSWDGTVEIYTKDFNNQQFNMRLIKIGDEWLPYDISNLDNTFLLSTWSSPEFKFFYPELNDDFEVTDTFKIELPTGNPILNPAPDAPVNNEQPENNTVPEAPTDENLSEPIAPIIVDPNADESVQGNISAPGPQ